MSKFLRLFLRCEDGAVTIDWVVLTASIVGLGVVIGTLVGNGTTVQAGKIESNLASQELVTYQ